MLSPLLSNVPPLFDGPSPDAAGTSSASGETCRFAQLLTSCMKNPEVCGETATAPDLSKEGSSEPSYSSPFALLPLLQGIVKVPLKAGMEETIPAFASGKSPMKESLKAGMKETGEENSSSSFALLPLLQGAVKIPLKAGTKEAIPAFASAKSAVKGSLKAGMKETGEENSPEGALRYPNGPLSGSLPLPGEASGFSIPSGSSPASLTPGEKEESALLLSSKGLPPAEEESAEEDCMTSGCSPLGDSPRLSAKDSTGEEDLLPVQKTNVHAENAVLVSGPSAVPGQEEISAPGKTLPEAREISPGKRDPADAVLLASRRKEGTSVPPPEYAPEEKDGEASYSAGTGEGKNPAAKNAGNGGESLSSSSGEDEKNFSQSEKEFPVLKNPAQDSTRKAHEPLPADKEDQKEPQPIRSRNGESSFSGVLRTAGAAEGKGTVPVSRGAEVPLSGRSGEALGEGMTNVVRFLKRDGLHRATIVVEPPALGRVEIELSSTAGGVEASIKVGNEQLRQLVQDQVTVLRNSLSQQGVQMTSCTVDIGDGENGRGSEKQAGEGKNVFVPRTERDGGEENLSFRVDLEQGLLYWMA